MCPCRSRRIGALLCAAALASAAAWVAPVLARSVYVDPVNGDDSRLGDDPSRALLTLTRGLSLAAAGDTLVALPGTFSMAANGETFPLEMKARVSLISRDGPERTIIQDDDASAEPQNVTIRMSLGPGRDFDGAAVEGFTIDGGDLEQNRAGILVQCSGASTGVSPVIRGNVIRNYTGADWIEIDGSGVLVWVEAQGAADTVSSPLIERNVIRDNDEGISAYAISVQGQGRALEAGTVRNNMVVANAYGIVCLTNPVENDPRAARGKAFVQTHVVSNTVYGSRFDGIQLAPFDAVTERAVLPLLAHNIVQQCGEYGIGELGALADPLYLSGNNISFCSLGLYLDEGASTLTTLGAVNALPEAAGMRPNLNEDATFVNAQEPIYDLHLAAGSTLIDLIPPGDPWVPALDFEGDTRPTGASSDVGADEFRSVARSDLMRDDSVRSLAPPVPARRSDYLPLDPATDVYIGVTPGMVDPDLGILTRTTRPLVFYQLVDPAPILKLLKQPGQDTVVFLY